MIRGGCSCGAVHFVSDAEPVMQVICHCTDCREATGNDYSVTAFFRRSSCRVGGPLVGMSFIAASGNRTVREACTDCGTMVFDRSEGFPELIGVFAERLAPPFIAEPACHMWTASRLPIVDVRPDLPEYAEGITG